MFKRSRHVNLFIFIFCENYYELSKPPIQVNANLYHIFEPTNFRDVPNLYQDKASMDRTLNEIKSLTSTR